MLDLGDGSVVQTAGPFLAVAADEGNGIPVFEHLGAVLDLPVLHGQQLCDVLDV